jgi:hypothetical protein
LSDFWEKLAVGFDYAAYFTANAVKDFRRRHGNRTDLLSTPFTAAQSVRGVLAAVQAIFGNRSFDDFAELRDAIHPALDAVSPPNIRNYLLP